MEGEGALVPCVGRRREMVLCVCRMGHRSFVEGRGALVLCWREEEHWCYVDKEGHWFLMDGEGGH